MISELFYAVHREYFLSRFSGVKQTLLPLKLVLFPCYCDLLILWQYSSMNAIKCFYVSRFHLLFSHVLRSRSIQWYIWSWTFVGLGRVPQFSGYYEKTLGSSNFKINLANPGVESVFTYAFTFLHIRAVYLLSIFSANRFALSLKKGM